eukprot:2278240-Alexandrium_andersonii.AAC.1
MSRRAETMHLGIHTGRPSRNHAIGHVRSGKTLRRTALDAPARLDNGKGRPPGMTIGYVNANHRLDRQCQAPATTPKT